MTISRLWLSVPLLFVAPAFAAEPVPDRTVVLTFDDAVKSHRTFVGPLLTELGFGATFFVTHRWMDDAENFMTWEDIGELHELGFEIGNHSWTHAGASSPKVASRLAGELALVDYELERVGVPKPVSFGWCGNGFGPEARQVLAAHGIRFARRGMQPEIPYGEITPGPLYDVRQHDPLLIPTGGDAYPDWTLDHFKRVVDRAGDGKIVVLQFHGVPDTAHPWVHTPPERFEEYMDYLKDGGFHVIALRDVARYYSPDDGAEDPLTGTRYPEKDEAELDLPTEVVQTRENPVEWYGNMVFDHGYSKAEVMQVFGYDADDSHTLASLREQAANERNADDDSAPRILPYPGGRHPRIGFREGMIDPQRGTKVSVFTPWETGSYVVFDVPEAIFSNLGLTFLAHTHIPTIWDDQNTVIDNVDWAPTADGAGYTFTRTLPNGIRFGSIVSIVDGGADAVMWLENGTDAPLTKMRTQVCAMLGAVPGFTHQTSEGKTLGKSVTVAKSSQADRYILVAFDHCGRTWENKKCPCIHADPVFPDAAPGERVEVRGRLWFYEGDDIQGEIARAEKRFTGSNPAVP